MQTWLELLAYSFAMAPFAFFWCCCKVDCFACAAPVTRSFGVRFFGVTDGTFCSDCSQIEDTLYTLAVNESLLPLPCTWELVVPAEDQVCDAIQKIIFHVSISPGFGFPQTWYLEVYGRSSGIDNVKIGQWTYSPTLNGSHKADCTGEWTMTADPAFFGWDGNRCNYFTAAPVVYLS